MFQKDQLWESLDFTFEMPEGFTVYLFLKNMEISPHRGHLNSMEYFPRAISFPNSLLHRGHRTSPGPLALLSMTDISRGTRTTPIITFQITLRVC